MNRLQNNSVMESGGARKKNCAARRRFTPCAAAGSLLEAVIIAAKNAAPGDVSLFSPASSSFDLSQNYQHRGEVFRFPANETAGANHSTQTKIVTNRKFKFAPGFFEEKPRREKTKPNQTTTS